MTDITSETSDTRQTRKVKITRRIYFSEESGYGVFEAAHRDGGPPLILVGNLLDVNQGDAIEITGEAVHHPKFGRQFKVASHTILMPDDKKGIIQFLTTRIDGVGKKTAEKIAALFGPATFQIIQNHPERLREVKGLRKDLIEKISEGMKHGKILRELTMKLAPLGLGPETIYKIYKAHGEISLHVLETNPYELIHSVRGVGFKIADTVARGVGLPRDSYQRIEAGILHLFSVAEQQKGDLYMDESDLLDKSSSLLDIPVPAVSAVIEEMKKKNLLIPQQVDQPALTRTPIFHTEAAIARMMKQRVEPGSLLPVFHIDFNEINRSTSVQLTPQQQNAVISALNHRLTIITGGPGTGKTTIIRAVIRGFEKYEKNILVAAPTGRAAKRIEEATHYPASTIHRTLEFIPETGSFLHNEANPLKADVIIVDEFSMVDVFLFYALLKAIAVQTRLVLIGDRDQLPSVGPGNVLRDIIASGFFPVICLDRNFRQTENSLIIENAYRINGGESLIFKTYSDDLDFVFIRVADEQKAQEKVLGILNYYREIFPFNSSDMQILSPMYRGDAGIDALNQVIQERFNPEPFLVVRQGGGFKRFDKVMQLKNNYVKGVFNGEQGLVVEYSAEKRILHVNFDGRDVEYALADLEELTLSYAVSVHKAQGSEYRMAVLILMPSHFIMLHRELFYTAVTRAKQKLVLISDEATVTRAVQNAAPSQRKTLLPLRLQEVFG